MSRVADAGGDCALFRQSLRAQRQQAALAGDGDAVRRAGVYYRVDSFCGCDHQGFLIAWASMFLVLVGAQLSF